MQTAAAQPAFHLLPVEYPPLTLVPFSVPLVLPLPYYSLVFALSMLLVAGGICWLLARFHSQKASRLFLLYLVLGAAFLVQIRFDILPAACMLICLIAAERKRWNLAYGALAVGVLLKFYPLVALPALFIAEQGARSDFSTPFSVAPLEKLPRWKQMSRVVLSWQWKHLSLFVGMLLGVTGCFALLNQDAIATPIKALIQRPPQVESLQSSLLWLAQVVGVPFHLIFSYGSVNAVSPISSVISWGGLGLCLAGSLFVFTLQWRGKLSLGQAMIALLCLLISSGKVFSPQYLIWLIPLIAYVGPSRKWLYAWAAVSLLTTDVYLFYYSHVTSAAAAPQVLESLPGFFETLLLRNSMFLFLTLAYLFNWFQVRQTTSSSVETGPKALSSAVALPEFARSERL
jgi:hypothetical protein